MGAVRPPAGRECPGDRVRDRRQQPEQSTSLSDVLGLPSLGNRGEDELREEGCSEEGVIFVFLLIGTSEQGHWGVGRYQTLTWFRSSLSRIFR